MRRTRWSIHTIAALAFVAWFYMYKRTFFSTNEQMKLDIVLTPFSSDTDATEKSLDHVADVLPTVEAFVGIHPHTIDRVRSFRLS